MLDPYLGRTYIFIFLRTESLCTGHYLFILVVHEYLFWGTLLSCFVWPLAAVRTASSWIHPARVDGQRPFDASWMSVMSVCRHNFLNTTQCRWEVRMMFVFQMSRRTPAVGRQVETRTTDSSTRTAIPTAMCRIATGGATDAAMRMRTTSDRIELSEICWIEYIVYHCTCHHNIIEKCFKKSIV